MTCRGRGVTLPRLGVISGNGRAGVRAMSSHAHLTGHVANTDYIAVDGPVIRLSEPSGVGLRFQGKRRT